MAWTLQEVRLTGFKSFSRRTRIVMSAGMTAIVGSNGCGKTNIADAIRFAMGEMRPHLLRVENLEDVVFAGTAQAPPVTVSEVTLHFEDKETGEAFSVARRAVRGGDGEYRIDGQLSRLKDVQRKLESIGITSQRGAVVELRQMDELLIDGSKLPRLLVEEGCGISPFLERKQQAQNKLNDAVKLLDGIEPRLQQMQLELARLSVQAIRAKKWQATMKSLEVARLNERWGAVRDLRIRYSQEQNQLEQLILNSLVEQTEAALRTRLMELEGTFEQLHEQYERDTEELFTLSTSRDELANRLRQCEIELAKSETSLASAIEENSRNTLSISEANREIVTDLYDRISALRLQLQEITDKHVTTTETKSRLQVERTKYQDVCTQYEAQRTAVIRSIEADRHEEELLQRSLIDQQPLPIPSTENSNRLLEQLAILQNDQLKFQELRQQHELKLREMTEQVYGAEQSVTTVQTELKRADREIEWLEKLLTERPDLTDELRKFLVEFRTEVTLLRDEGVSYSEALLQVSGLDRFVTTQASLSKVVSEAVLRKLSAEWVTATTTEIVDFNQLVSHVPPAGIEWICTDGVSRNASGVVRTGSGAATGLPVGLPQQLRVWQDRRGELQSEFDTKQATLNDAKTARDKVQQELNSILDSIKLLQPQIEQVNEELARLQAEHRELIRRNEFREAERLRITTALEKLNVHKSAQEAVLQSLTVPVEPELIHTLPEIEREWNAETQSLQILSNDVRSLEQEIKHFEFQKEQRKALVERLSARLVELELREKELNEFILTTKAQQQILQNDVSSLNEREKEVAAKRAESSQARQKLQTEVQTTRKEFDVARSAAEEWRTAVALLTEQVKRTDIELQEQTASASETGPEPKETVKIGADAIRRLENRLHSLEPVNHLAQQEYETIEKDVNYLRSEREQILAAADIHRKAVDEAVKFAIERLTQSRLRIERMFADIIARLFPGGEASLEWGEGDILNEAPLLLRVSPRGKRIRTLRILSGGERALVALAFLVAVLSQQKPLPFLVMDEVDAPLDEENTHRFLHWLKDLTSSTQVILLTHNRQSIANSNSWIGVSMPEPGISQVVKVVPAMESA